MTGVATCAPTAVLRRALGLLDAAVEGRAGVAALLFDTPTLVIGSSQRIETVDAARAEADGVSVLRRGSGGGAVLCDGGLLEVDVALPAGHPLLASDVTESYRWLGERWVGALAVLGIDARLVTVASARGLPPGRREAARVACYAGLSPFEVVAADGRKLVGLCQRRRGGASLFQCSLACSTPPAAAAIYLRVEPGMLDLTASLAELGVVASPAAVWAALEPLLGDV